MLQAAQDRMDAFPVDHVSPAAPSSAIVPIPVRMVPPGSTGGRYGARGRPNLPAILVILALHAVLIGALIQVRNHIIRAEDAKLTVVNLTPAPPPPAEEAPPPPPSKPDIVAPVPIVQTPAAPVPIATTPDPTPISAPSPATPAPPAPPAPSVAVAAPSVAQLGDIGVQMLSGKLPRYPLDSRRKREQGTVVLALRVGTDGAVEKISVARSSGFSRLDDAARDAVKHWRWRPILRGGQAVPVEGVVEIPFVIRSDSA